MFQLPQVNLDDILPIAGLALIAAVCIVALLLHGLLRSRLALLIAVVIGVVLAGPALAGALTSIVWALVPLGIVAIAGAVFVVWLMHRNPELRAMLHEVLPARPAAGQAPPLLDPGEPGHAITVIDQPAAQPARTRVSKSSGDGWGF